MDGSAERYNSPDMVRRRFARGLRIGNITDGAGSKSHSPGSQPLEVKTVSGPCVVAGISKTEFHKSPRLTKEEAIRS